MRDVTPFRLGLLWHLSDTSIRLRAPALTPASMLHLTNPCIEPKGSQPNWTQRHEPKSLGYYITEGKTLNSKPRAEVHMAGRYSVETRSENKCDGTEVELYCTLLFTLITLVSYCISKYWSFMEMLLLRFKLRFIVSQDQWVLTPIKALSLHIVA